MRWPCVQTPLSQAPSQLDDSLPITPLQSATILNALKAIAPQVLSIFTVLSGKTFDIAWVNHLIDSGFTLLLNGVSIYYLLHTIKSRINATKTIIKKG